MRASQPVRTPAPLPPERPSIPLLDASSLPAAEDWTLVEALGRAAPELDPDDDRFAGLSFNADSLD